MNNILLNRLSPYKGKETIFLHSQGVGDIMQGIISTHKQYRNEYDKICFLFDGANDYEIGKKIFDYLKKNVAYVIEPDNKQMLKSPSAIIATGKTTGSDCKNYSLFTGGILDALNRRGKNIKWCYRFSSYKFGDKIPQHVFTVINPDSNNEIWIDAVLPKYNYKKQYYYKIDKKVKPMLVGLSGIETIAGTKKVNAKKVVDNAKKKARQKTFQKVKQKIQQRGKVVLKFAAAPSRNAFLLLVKLNVRGLATKLKTLATKQPEKLKKFWVNSGGNYAALLKEIERGSKKKRLLGIGAVPAVAAAIASATPLILAVTKLFSAAGIRGEDLANVAAKAIKGKAKEEIQSINAAANGEDIQADYETDNESIDGIGAKKTARKTKKAAKKTTRQTKKTARKTKRAAKKAPKGGFSDNVSEIEKADLQATDAVKKAARKKRLQIAQQVLETGSDIVSSKVSDNMQNLSEIENEAKAEEQQIEQATNATGKDNKMLYVGLAAAAAAGLYIATKEKR